MPWRPVGTGHEFVHPIRGKVADSFHACGEGVAEGMAVAGGVAPSGFAGFREDGDEIAEDFVGGGEVGFHDESGEGVIHSVLVDAAVGVQYVAGGQAAGWVEVNIGGAGVTVSAGGIVVLGTGSAVVVRGVVVRRRGGRVIAWWGIGAVVGTAGYGWGRCRWGWRRRGGGTARRFGFRGGGCGFGSRGMLVAMVVVAAGHGVVPSRDGGDAEREAGIRRSQLKLHVGSDGTEIPARAFVPSLEIDAETGAGSDSGEHGRFHFHGVRRLL